MKNLRPISKTRMKNIQGGNKFWGTECVQVGSGRFEYGVTNPDGSGVEGTLDYVCDYECTYYVMGVPTSNNQLIGTSCNY